MTDKPPPSENESQAKYFGRLQEIKQSSSWKSAGAVSYKGQTVWHASMNKRSRNEEIVQFCSNWDRNTWTNACSAAGEWNVGNLLKASYKKVLTCHYQFQMAELEMLHFVEYNIYLTGWDNKLVRLTSSITSSPTHVCQSSRAVAKISSC